MRTVCSDKEIKNDINIFSGSSSFNLIRCANIRFKGSYKNGYKASVKKQTYIIHWVTFFKWEYFSRYLIGNVLSWIAICALYLSTPNHDYRLSANYGTEIDTTFLLHKIYHNVAQKSLAWGVVYITNAMYETKCHFPFVLRTNVTWCKVYIFRSFCGDAWI